MGGAAAPAPGRGGHRLWLVMVRPPVWEGRRATPPVGAGSIRAHAKNQKLASKVCFLKTWLISTVVDAAAFYIFVFLVLAGESCLSCVFLSILVCA